MGPKTVFFEEELAQYIGVKHVVAVNSCTAALHLFGSLLLTWLGMRTAAIWFTPG